MASDEKSTNPDAIQPIEENPSSRGPQSSRGIQAREIISGALGELREIQYPKFRALEPCAPLLIQRANVVTVQHILDLGHTYNYINDIKPSDIMPEKKNLWVTQANATWTYRGEEFIKIEVVWVVLYFVCVAILLVYGILRFIVESLTVAPDVLGYVSTMARNLKNLQQRLPKVSSAMSGGQRAKVLCKGKVMMQYVKANGVKLQPGGLCR